MLLLILCIDDLIMFVWTVIHVRKIRKELKIKALRQQEETTTSGLNFDIET